MDYLCGLDFVAFGHVESRTIISDHKQEPEYDYDVEKQREAKN